LNATIGVLLALHERGRSGQGQLVDASLYDSGLSLLHPHAANWFMGRKLPQRSGNAHPNIYPYDVLSTGGAPIFLAVGNDRQFRLLCQHVGQEDWRRTSALPAQASAPSIAPSSKPLLEQAFALDGLKLADELMAIGVPAAPVLDVAQALEHPHTVHREMVVTMGQYQGWALRSSSAARRPATALRP
jgi:crotonobetainyl-CoA:carnitine CoA-transferase CaiB-like acyl-CoA transferase